MRARRSKLIGLTAACVLLVGCPQRVDPVAKGLACLRATQTTAIEEALRNGGKVADYKGNWPQVFFFRQAPALRIPEVSPFVVAFIHHSLTLVNDTTAGSLGLSGQEAESARLMRQRAIAFLHRFEASPGEPDAGTFGFWPYDANPGAPESPIQQALLEWVQGPILEGNRLPLNLDIFPHGLAIPTDADVTATTYAAILDDANLDGGPGTNVAMEQFFADWRDLGVVPRRLNPEWLPPASGAYLTWLSYKDPPDFSVPSDIDLVVNANVLFALARYGKTSTAGFTEAVSLINSAVQQGLHRTRFRDISDYYPASYVFHYCVSRAFHEGPVPGLGPAVETLADDLEADVRPRWDGTVYWNQGDPHLNTAFALLTLMNAGRDTDLIDKGVAYLVNQQDPILGCWDEGVFFVAHMDGGQEVHWASAALTTAFVLEAMCRYRLD